MAEAYMSRNYAGVAPTAIFIFVQELLNFNSSNVEQCHNPRIAVKSLSVVPDV